MRTILRNIMILAVTASPAFTGCMPEGRQINYDIQAGNELYLPADGISVDLSRGSDVPEGIFLDTILSQSCLSVRVCQGSPCR